MEQRCFGKVVQPLLPILARLIHCLRQRVLVIDFDELAAHAHREQDATSADPRIPHRICEWRLQKYCGSLALTEVKRPDYDHSRETREPQGTSCG